MAETKTIALICPHHGFTRGNVCPECHPPEESINIQTDSWVTGWWEHIDKDPIYIKDCKHLIEECNKRGVYPKALIKHKSQGNGYECSRGLSSGR